MTNCIFCDIVNGKIATKLIYKDQHIIAFNDLYPKADVHLLIVPRTHIASLNAIHNEHSTLIADMLLLLPRLAREHQLEQGYRTIINTGPGGGQEVNHLHFHLLGSHSGQVPGFSHGAG